MSLRKKLALVFLVTLFAGSLEADIISLNNGDRITGTVVERTAEIVRVQSPLMGEIVIPASSIKNIVEQPLTPPPSPEVVAEAVQSAGLPAKEIARAIEDEIAEKEVERALFGIPLLGSFLEYLEGLNPIRTWKSKVSIGLGWLAGEKDSRNLNFQFNTHRKTDSREMRFDSLYEYGTTENDLGQEVPNRDRTRFTLLFRENMTERFFLQSNSFYLRNNITLIDNEARQSLGAGWRFIKNNRWGGTITPSLSAQYLELAGEDGEWNLAPALYEELSYDFNKRITFRQELNILTAWGDDAQTSYMFLLRMESKLLDNITFNIEYEFNYDGNVAENVERTQQGINALIGVQF